MEGAFMDTTDSKYCKDGKLITTRLIVAFCILVLMGTLLILCGCGSTADTNTAPGTQQPGQGNTTAPAASDSSNGLPVGQEDETQSSEQTSTGVTNEHYEWIAAQANRIAQQYRNNGYEVTGVYVCTPNHPNGYVVWFIDPATGKEVAATCDFEF